MGQNEIQNIQHNKPTLNDNQLCFVMDALSDIIKTYKQ